MFQIAGGAIGLGITTTIFTLTSENELADKADAAGTHLTDHQVAVMHGVLAGTDSGNGGASPAQLVGPDNDHGDRARVVRDRHPGRLPVRGHRRGARLPDLAVLRRRAAAAQRVAAEQAQA